MRNRPAQGDADSQYALGIYYEIGRVVPQDYVTAREWYVKAAAQDYTPAEKRLGELYERGLGVPKNRELALEWYQKAATHGDTSVPHTVPGAEGFNTGKGPYGSPGVDLIATVVSTSSVYVIDRVDNRIQRPLVTIRLDFPEDPKYKEWFEVICLSEAVSQEEPVRLTCANFLPGHKYLLVGTKAGSLLEFHPFKSEYPFYEYQGWKRCTGTPQNCYRLGNDPIRMIKRQGGKVEH